MIDLKFSYTHSSGGPVVEEHDTIMHFTDGVESGVYPPKTLCCGPVNVRFFENPLLDKQFATVQDLYNHCSAIMRGHK